MKETASSIPGENADETPEILQRLIKECREAGLETQITEPGRSLRVNRPGAGEHMAEELELTRNGLGYPIWRWSWGEPIGRAEDIDMAVEVIAGVLRCGRGFGFLHWLGRRSENGKANNARPE